MQDGNTLTWTEPRARAETVALGPRRDSWTAPIAPVEAFAAKIAPKDEAVHAKANHGRWIVECPDCCGAQFACPDDPRFMCSECANAVIGGLWRIVIWPQDRLVIDALLMRRPLANRNWQPGESLTFLQAENEANGAA